MALRGDYLTIKVQQHSSGTANEVVAETTSVSVDFSAEALETTNQTSGLNASFIGGKVTGTVTGDFLVATAAANYNTLFDIMNAGSSIEVQVLVSGTNIHSGSGVITSLSASGGNSDQLITGSYSIQLSGNMSD